MIGSVGLRGVNNVADVRTVRALLAEHGIDPGPGGDVDDAMIAAIVKFQTRLLHHPDGLVTANGLTWKKLNQHRSQVPVRHLPVHAIPPSGDWKEIMTLTTKDSLNAGLTAVTDDFMKTRFGWPRETFTQDDQPLTNVELKKKMGTIKIGKHTYTGLGRLMDSLAAVLEEVEDEYPESASLITSAGVLVCRLRRGSTTKISNHSWGSAIDLKIGGVLTERGSDEIKYGLYEVAPTFRSHGWYWGAAFHTTDAMHFEASHQLIDKLYPS